MAGAENNALRRLASPSIVLGMACLLLHLIVNTRYGVFRDELYYIVCGEHPALAAEFAGILGGGRFAQWFSGLAVLVGPVFLALGLLLTTDALQPLTWLA